jgi:hypothetical protein
MSTARTVEVEAIHQRRSLQLFVNGNNAWMHMRDHALGIRKAGEELGWGLLLPSLRVALDANRFGTLRDQSRATDRDPGHPPLSLIYNEFLDRVQQSVERASRLGWFWEEHPGADCRWFTFSPESIIACLDEDFVRTGYLPEHDPSRWSGGVGDPCFRLFQASLARVQAKYNRAVDSGRIQSIHPALAAILRSGLSETAWSALR